MIWCWGTSFIRSTTAHETTTNQKNVKNWSGDYIGGMPTALLLFWYVIHIHIICKKTKVQRVVEKRSSPDSSTARPPPWYHYQSKERQKLIKWLYWSIPTVLLPSSLMIYTITTKAACSFGLWGSRSLLEGNYVRSLSWLQVLGYSSSARDYNELIARQHSGGVATTKQQWLLPLSF